MQTRLKEIEEDLKSTRLQQVQTESKLIESQKELKQVVSVCNVILCYFVWLWW